MVGKLENFTLHYHLFKLMNPFSWAYNITLILTRKINLLLQDSSLELINKWTCHLIVLYNKIFCFQVQIIISIVFMVLLFLPLLPTTTTVLNTIHLNQQYSSFGLENAVDITAAGNKCTTTPSNQWENCWD